MADPKLPTTQVEALALVMGSTFRPFTSHDWAAYACCESEAPQIAERDDGLIIVIDGADIAFMFDDADGGLHDTSYSLVNRG